MRPDIWCELEAPRGEAFGDREQVVVGEEPITVQKNAQQARFSPYEILQE